MSLLFMYKCGGVWLASTGLYKVCEEGAGRRVCRRWRWDPSWRSPGSSSHCSAPPYCESGTAEKKTYFKERTFKTKFNGQSLLIYSPLFWGKTHPRIFFVNLATVKKNFEKYSKKLQLETNILTKDKWLNAGVTKLRLVFNIDKRIV